MIKVVSVGAYHTQNDYNGKHYDNYYLVLGRSIDDKDGFGFNPLTVKVDYDRYKSFIENTSSEFGIEMDISYEYGYDKSGKGKYILTDIKY